MRQEVTSSFPLFCKLGFHVDNVEVTKLLQLLNTNTTGF